MTEQGEQYEVYPNNVKKVFKKIITPKLHKNITGSEYRTFASNNLNKNTQIIVYNRNRRDNKKNEILSEQFIYRVGMLVRLIDNCVTQVGFNRDKSKELLRKSLNNVNNTSKWPFDIYPAAFKVLIKDRTLSPAKDDKLIASFYRIFSEFHDDVAEDGDTQVKQKLQKEADRYNKLSFFSNVGKRIRGRGCTRRRHHKKKRHTRRRRTCRR